MEFLKAAARSALHVSVSQVRGWIACPRRFEARHILGWEPEHKHTNLVLGIAFHEAVAEHYRELRSGRQLEIAAAVEVFRKALSSSVAEGPPLLLEGGETLADLEQQGRGLLEVFLANATVPAQVIGVEQEFSCDVTDPSTGEFLEEGLLGYLDATVEDADGTRVVLEHKTAARAWSQDQLDFDLQVGLYLAATGAQAVRLQVAVKTKVPKFVTHDLTRTDREQVEAVQVVCGVLKAIRAGAFWPQRGWQCRECEFRARCAG
jgi:CRISPR/Cas system-associated exonuclease Cas4 (RecB family)